MFFMDTVGPREETFTDCIDGLYMIQFPLEVICVKSTGMVRRSDELGRIVIPMELRRTLDIKIKDALEIFVDGELIILQKYEPACVFCDNARDVIRFKGKNVCPDCLKEMTNVNA